MLIQFNFKNFMSFRDETSLDMTATKITEHPVHVVETGGDKLLTVAAIYGANASGKSNVFNAFSFMRDYVVNSFYFGGDSGRKNSEVRKVTPYLFDRESRDKPSEFEVFYVDQTNGREKTYQYGFVIQNTEIMEEWLYSKAKTSLDYRTIFYRKKGEALEADGLGKKAVANLKEALQKETLIVSLGAKLNIALLTAVYNWFTNCETVHLAKMGEEFSRASDLPAGFVSDRTVQENVLSYIASFDTSIVDFEIEEVKRTDEELLGKSYAVHTIHRLADGSGLQSILLGNESSGTRKMLALYEPLKYVLDHGSVMFIDELNDRLHPLLVRNIILTFLTPEINTNHAQLILTSHDVWQFSNELLRRDELWITEKSRDGVSTLYSVADFKDEEGKKIRRNEAIAKNYLVGNYGGIPALKPLVIMGRSGADGK